MRLSYQCRYTSIASTSTSVLQVPQAASTSKFGEVEPWKEPVSQRCTYLWLRCMRMEWAHIIELHTSEEKVIYYKLQRVYIAGYTINNTVCFSFAWYDWFIVKFGGIDSWYTCLVPCESLWGGPFNNRNLLLYMLSTAFAGELSEVTCTITVLSQRIGPFPYSTLLSYGHQLAPISLAPISLVVVRVNSGTNGTVCRFVPD